MMKSGDRRSHALHALLSWCLLGLSVCSPETVARQPPRAGFPSPPPTAGAGSAPASAGSGTAGIIALPPPTSGQAAWDPPTAGSAGEPMLMLMPFDAGMDPKLNNAMPGQLCARLAMINCAGEVHCCDHPGRTVETCRSDIKTACEQQLYLDQIAMDPITHFDPAAAMNAFTQLEAKESQCDLSVTAWGISLEGPRGMLKGTIAPGASCKPLKNLTDPPTAAAALVSCTGAATTSCLPENLLGDWKCSPKNNANGSCVTDDNCADGLFCSNPMKTLGNCMQRAALGASCNDGGQCSSLYCKAGKCVTGDQQLAYCLKM